MADYYVREEDGTSKYVLEDSSGDYLLEHQGFPDPGFISSVTAVYTPTLHGPVEPSFIASVTVVYAATLRGPPRPPFIASVTSVHTPIVRKTLVPDLATSAVFGAPVFGWAYFASGPRRLTVQVPAPYIASTTVVYTPALRPFQIFPSFIASVTTVYTPTLPVHVTASFIPSSTVVYTPALRPGQIFASFISSVTTVYTPTLFKKAVFAPFIGSVTVVYTPQISQTVFGVMPFIASVTQVYLPTLMQTFTGGGVSQVALEVAAGSTDGDALVSQVTLEIVVPQYKDLHIWQTS